MKLPRKKHIVRHSSERLEQVGVMVLDADRTAAGIYCHMLEALGFRQIHMVADSFEAVQILKSHHIHLLLADVELKLHLRQVDPVMRDSVRESVFPMSGISMVQRLRQSPISPNPFLPVIMLLDGGHDEQAKAARSVGVNEVIYKPISAEELCGRITEIVEHPRVFVTAPSYTGPCRRVENVPLPYGKRDKRQRVVRLVRYERPLGAINGSY